MQGRGNARFPCTPSSKPTSTTNKNRLAARTGKKLGCGNDARWNPWKSPTPTFPPLPPHLEIPQQTRDSHIPTATTTTGYRGLEQHQTKFNTKINTNNKTKVVYTDNLTHPAGDPENCFGEFHGLTLGAGKHGLRPRAVLAGLGVFSHSLPGTSLPGFHMLPLRGCRLADFTAPLFCAPI